MRILVLASLAAVLLIAGCSGSDHLTSPGNAPGHVQFQMSLAPARAAGISVTRVVASLTHLTEPAADSIDLAIAPDSLSASGTIDGLIPGLWRVEVGLYDSTPTLIASGSDTITVVSGEITEALIVIAFTGGAHITVTWASGGSGETGWDDFGQGGGLDGIVLALGEYQGQLIAAGDFHHAGGQPAEYIARWDGAAWHPLGSGVNGRVFALQEYGGELIAAGEFSQAGGAPAAAIAAWDGSGWHALGGSLAGAYQGPMGEALAIYNGCLIVSGPFEMAGGVAASMIASWNGTTWAALGSGTGWCGEALTVFQGNLIDGGWFSSAGAVEASRIAQWNGSSWSSMGAGMSGGSNVVIRLASDDTHVYAFGDFTSPGRNCAMWDGSSWWPMGAGFDSNCWAAAIYHQTLYAGTAGNYSGGVRVNHIAAWNGGEWEEVGGGVWGSGGVNGGNVDALFVFGDALYVGGDFTVAGGVPVHNIARWRTTPGAS